MPGIFCWQSTRLWTSCRLRQGSCISPSFEPVPGATPMYLSTTSLLPAFCRCHQVLHVLKHLHAPSSTKSIFLPAPFVLFPCRELSLGCYPLLCSIPAGPGRRANGVLQKKSQSIKFHCLWQEKDLIICISEQRHYRRPCLRV